MIQFDYILTTFSIIGAYFNCSKRLFLSYLIWSFSNLGWVIWWGVNEQWASMILFLVYLFFSIKGIINYDW